jgi:hypothetical protein
LAVANEHSKSHFNAAMPTRSRSISNSSRVALFEFLATPARARVIAADVFQGITHRLLMPVVAVRAVHMAVVMVVVVIMVVGAVRTVDVGFIAHQRVTPE